MLYISARIVYIKHRNTGSINLTKEFFFSLSVVEATYTVLLNQMILKNKRKKPHLIYNPAEMRCWR